VTDGPRAFGATSPAVVRVAIPYSMIERVRAASREQCVCEERDGEAFVLCDPCVEANGASAELREVVLCLARAALDGT
jgi:hypothetical protein